MSINYGMMVWIVAGADQVPTLYLVATYLGQSNMA
jgi:hypothetical protein